MTSHGSSNEVVKGDLFKINREYAAGEHDKARKLLVSEMGLEITYAKFLQEFLGVGSTYLEEFLRVGSFTATATAEDSEPPGPGPDDSETPTPTPSVRWQAARRDVGSLPTRCIADFNNEFRIFHGDRVEQTRRNTRLWRRGVEQFCVSSKHVVVRASEASDIQKVVERWKEARNHANVMYSIYGGTKERVEQYQEDLSGLVTKFNDLDREVHEQRGSYTSDQVDRLVSIAMNFHETHKAASALRQHVYVYKYSEARSAIDKLFQGMEAYRKDFDKEEKRKNQEREKKAALRLKENLGSKHVNYDLKIEFSRERMLRKDFTATVHVREGQQPVFCGAQQEEFQPTPGGQNIGWEMPRLQARLDTTNNPLKLSLNELIVSIGPIGGTFSGKDIVIDLPASRRSRPSAQTHKGTIGESGGFLEYTLKITARKVSTQDCNRQLCERSSRTTWVNSGVVKTDPSRG